METIRATVNRIIFSNDQTGFKVFVAIREVGTESKETTTKSIIIKGEFGPDIVPESTADFHGHFITHAKYGFQFNAKSYTMVFNAEELNSIKIFLQEISPSIGAERANFIVDYFKTETIQVLDENPARLLEVPGIGPVSAENLIVAWKEKRYKWDEDRIIYSLRSFLTSLGVKERRIKRVLDYFKGHEIDAEDRLRKNPYELIEIDGFGFSIVDFIARKLGISEGHPDRFSAYILYCLEIVCPSFGHLFLTMEQLEEMIQNFCIENRTTFLDKVLNTNDVQIALNNLKEKVVVDENKIYHSKQYFYENESAKLLREMIITQSDLIFLNRSTVSDFIERFERQTNMILSEEQRNALYYFAERKVFVLTGAPGTGKCLGKDTPVMMYDGSIKKVQDIITGDLIMGDDSTYRTVLNITSGKDNLYKVIPVKGDPYIINSEHVLSLKANTDKGLKKGKVYDIPLPDYFKLPIHKKGHLKGYRVPISFPGKNVPISPYLIGYWLGNGSKSWTAIFCYHQEIIDNISNIVSPYNLIVKDLRSESTDKRRGKNVTYSIRTKGKDFEKSNYFLNTLRDLDILNDKHIPEIYLHNSIENRLLLLAGILDADGSLDSSNTFELTLERKLLLEQTVYLARSLGFSAYISPVVKKWTSPKYDNKYCGEGIYYRTHICGNIEKIPTIAKNKKATERKQKKDVLVTGIKIEPIGQGDYFGFTLDGNGRFLLGDFTVTHNTQTLKAIVQLALSMRFNLSCMTPTGISAKKLSSTIDYEAYTIHRLLGFKGNEWSFNSMNKFDTDIVIIDESSMIDQEVFFRLLSALNRRTHLIFVGDHNQLPSVGAGNVLKELIGCGQIPVIILDKIFRQDAASDIVKAAHKIIHGDVSLDLFKTEPTSDIFFMRIKEITSIENIVIALAAKFKNDRRMFQTITPRNTGPLGVDSLNQILQLALNPPAPNLNEIKLNSFIIRKGDRVIIRKNDYQREVYNGDIGKVLEIAAGNVLIKIDEKTIELSIEEIEEKVKLAYAITAHKSQGLEYPTIILLFIKQHGKNLLQRNLLYTALTRAKSKVIVIGHGSAIEQAINNVSVTKRNTLLGERICYQMMKKDSSSERPPPQENSPDSSINPEQYLLETENF